MFFSHVCLTANCKFIKGTHMATTHNAIGQSQVTWDPQNMFKLVNLGFPQSDHPSRTTPSPPLDMFKIIHYIAQTSVGNWAVSIRLKCLLILLSTKFNTGRFRSNYMRNLASICIYDIHLLVDFFRRFHKSENN